MRRTGDDQGGEREDQPGRPERSWDQRTRTLLVLVGVAAAENRPTSGILAAPANGHRGLRSAPVQLCMFRPKDQELERGWPGRVDGDRVIQLAAQTLQAFFTGGGTAREHAEFRLDDVELLAPVLHPPSVRHFDAFADGDAPAFTSATRRRSSGRVTSCPLRRRGRHRVRARARRGDRRGRADRGSRS